jgi:hypothetical protein
MARPSSQDDRPVEGEILPPERPAPRDSRPSMDWRTAGWGGSDDQGLHRVHVMKVGPFGLLAFLLLFGAVVAVVFAVATTVFLFLIPIFLALIAIGLIVRFFRGGSLRQM